MSFDPDYEFEDFWLTFKNSIINFYDTFDESKIDSVLNLSNELNNLKKKENYKIIEFKIHNFIIDYSKDIFNLINNFDKDEYKYNLRIFFTNMKRWKKLRSNRVFFKEPIKYENLYYIMIDILRLSLKHSNNNEDIIKVFFVNAVDIIETKKYHLLVDYLLKMNIHSILNDLDKYYDYSNYLSEKYKIEIPPKISGRKLFYLINKNLS